MMNTRIRRMVDSLLRNSSQTKGWGRWSKWASPRRENSREISQRLFFEPLEARQLLSGVNQIVTSTQDTNSFGTLRYAINQINMDPDSGIDNVTFAIAAGGAQTIQLTSALPTITHKINIDGTTESGFNKATNVPIIQIDGSGVNNAGIGPANGLTLGPGSGDSAGGQAGSTIKGLIITHFSLNGIEIDDANNTIVGNYIGTTGSTKSGNTSNGILVNGNSTDAYGNSLLVPGTSIYKIGPNGVYGNIIGGPTADLRNVISSNNLFGIYFAGALSDNNAVWGNYIGTSADGASKLGNAGSGIQIESSGNLIGDGNAFSASLAGTGYGNVISGNGDAGVTLVKPTTQGTLIFGNLIGTDATGTYAIENFFAGVVVSGGGNRNYKDTIEYNVISGNAAYGVYTTGSSAVYTVIDRNYIGTDKTGGNAVPNRLDGVLLTSGLNFVDFNVVSGNLQNGVHVTGTISGGNEIGDNIIGEDAAGIRALGNSLAGIFIEGIQHLPTETDAFVIGNVVGGNNIGMEFLNIQGAAIISKTGDFPLQIAANSVGTNITGSSAVPNATVGIVFNNVTYANIGLRAYTMLVNSGTGTAEGVVVDSYPNTISGNGTDGVLVEGGSNNLTFTGNFIGTTPDGAQALGNGADGIDIINGQHNIIGVVSILGKLYGSESPRPADSEYAGDPGNKIYLPGNNTISGNLGNGIAISGASSTSNSILYDSIGLDVNFQYAIGNKGAGVFIDGAGGNIIGSVDENQPSFGSISLIPPSLPAAGDPPGEKVDPNLKGRNIISANQYGIHIHGVAKIANTVVNDYIGTNLAATSVMGTDNPSTPLGNTVAGILLDATINNTIGGATLPERNVISGSLNGIEITSLNSNDIVSQNNIIIGNYIGTDFTGTVGVDGNNISLGNGVVLRNNDTDKSYGAGIYILNAANNTVGGSIAAGNIISANGEGVRISGAKSTGNVIAGNRDGITADLFPKAVLRGVNVTNTPPAPLAIDDESNQTTIANGSTTGSSNATGGVDGTYFTWNANPGNAFLTQDGKGVTREFFIYNDGTTDLHFVVPPAATGGFSFPNQKQDAQGNPVPMGFTFVELPDLNTPVKPGQVVRFEIYMDTSVIGQLSQVVQITTDDPNQKVITFTVGGLVVANKDHVPGAPNPFPAPALTISEPTQPIYNGIAQPTITTSTAQTVGNFDNGVFIDGSANKNFIGAGGVGNVLSGNGVALTLDISSPNFPPPPNLHGAGVYIFGVNTSGNVVASNNIGVGPTGGVITDITDTRTIYVVPNQGSGVDIESAPGNTVGGLDSSSKNIISANRGDGVTVTGGGADKNTISSNYIGLDARGIPAEDALFNLLTLFLGNTGNGVTIANGATNTLVGGITAGQRNVIADNANGVQVDGIATTGNLIQGDYIGLSATGYLDVAGNPAYGLFAMTYNDLYGNLINGVEFDNVASNTVGGDIAGAINYIDDNKGNGIEFKGTTAGGNFVYNNTLGKSLSPGFVFPNGLNGIYLESPDNVIGGSDTFQSNYIGPNTLSGVYIFGATATNNFVQGNTITANAGDGVTIDSAGAVGTPGTKGYLSGNTIGGAGALFNSITTNNIGITIKGPGASGNMVYGNLIGSTLPISGNGLYGIYLLSPGNIIGSETPGMGNEIVGNGADGIRIENFSTTGTVIVNNMIGTDGTTAYGNGSNGIFAVGAPGLIVGDVSNPDKGRNIISGNTGAGVYISGQFATDAQIVGNYIGTDSSGNISSTVVKFTIPGTTDQALNDQNQLDAGLVDAGLQAAFASNGYTILTSANVVKVDNTVTLNKTTNTTYANQYIITDVNSGQYLVKQVLARPGSLHPIDLEVSKIIPNQLGNLQYGVRLDSSNNTVGGVGVDGKGNGTDGKPLANVIAGNVKSGVLVFGPNATNNSIVMNTIFGNGRLGIDLGQNPITLDFLNLNQPAPAPLTAAAPNNAQNFPIISVSSGTISGRLEASAFTTYRIDLYNSRDGQAQIYLGTVNVTTNSQGVGTFAGFVPITTTTPKLLLNGLVTATATKVNIDGTLGDTSEISNQASIFVAAHNLNSIDANVVSSLNVGTPVSQLFTATDVDTAQSQLGIAVTAVTSKATSNGFYQYSIDNGVSWTEFNEAVVSDSQAVLLGPASLVRFVPNAGYIGAQTGSITFKVWDEGNGLIGQTGIDTNHSLITNTDTTADQFVFSTQTGMTTVTVNLPPPTILGFTPDTGNIGDHITSGHRLTFFGTGTPNEFVILFLTDPTGKTVQITDPNHNIAVDGNGNWTFDYTGTLLTGGTYTLVGVSSSLLNAGTPVNPPNLSVPSANFVFTIIDPISITGKGKPIPNGSTTPTTINGTDFGSIVVGNAPVKVTFTITNTGDTQAVLTSVSSSNPAFQTGALTPAGSIQIGTASTFTVTFDPAVLGTYSATISIVYNATGSGINVPYTFVVTANVTPTVPVIKGIIPDTSATHTGVTVAQNLSFFGTGVSGELITLTLKTPTGTIVLPGSALVDITGNWIYDYTNVTLPVGTYVLTATATSGLNVSGTSVPFTFQIVAIVRVQGNGLDIQSGDTTPITADGTDFGTVILNGQGSSHTFVITNPSNINLVINSVTVPAGFTLLTPMNNLTLAPGETFNMVVRFDAGNYGAKSGTIAITYNQGSIDPNAAPGIYTFAVRGNVGTDDNGKYVDGLFEDLLGRPADQSAINGFTPILDNARLLSLPGVALTLLNSTESNIDYLNDPNTGLFHAYLGRPGSTSEVNNFLNMLNTGSTREQIVAIFAGSAEYYTHNGGTDQQFLTALYLNVLGRPIDPSALQAFMNLLAKRRRALGQSLDIYTLAATRSEIATQLLTSDEYRGKIVSDAYLSILGRPVDAGGLSFFKGQLQTGLRDENFYATLYGSGERLQVSGSTTNLWIQGLYTSIFGRTVDLGGMAAFTNQVLNGYQTARNSVVDAIIASNEYKARSVQSMFVSYLGRQGGPAEINGFVFQINQGLSYNAVKAIIIGSPEYFIRNGSTNRLWVTKVFADVLGRTVDASSANDFVAALNSGKARSDVALQIIQSSEASARVVGQVFTNLLNRTPTSSEIGFWVGQLQAGVTAEDMAVALGATAEYFLLVNPNG